MSEVELDKILAFVDDDGNGHITFSEFLTAAVHPEDVLTGAKLLQAFKNFDEDGSGSIDIDEIKSHIGKGMDLPDSAWDEMMAEIDEDGSGEIAQNEFIDMMTSIFNHD